MSVYVVVKEGANLGQVLREFRRRVTDAGTLRDWRKGRHYVKPSMAKRLKSRAAERRRRQEEERAKGYVRPVRTKYIHKCGAETVMAEALAETYARDPKFYGGTFCVGCGDHFPVAEFVWSDTDPTVGK